MTSKDEKRLNEDEMDELVEQVVERLGSDDEPDADERVRRAHQEAEAAREEAHEAATEARERARADAQEARERAREEAERRRERAEGRTGGLDDLGDRIERSVEASLEAVAENLERSLTPGRREPRDRRPDRGVTMGPEDTGRKAVYKTQLQKGGRVAVPDAEIEALDLDPGDTLQVVLYPVD